MSILIFSIRVQTVANFPISTMMKLSYLDELFFLVDIKCRSGMLHMLFHLQDDFLELLLSVVIFQTI